MSEQREFAGLTAIVSGGSRGIGKAAAGLFAARGANLVLVGRGIDALNSVADTLKQRFGAAVLVIAGNVADPKTARETVSTALGQFGRIDILANIAGAFPTALLGDTSDEHYSHTVASNLTGTFNMCRAVLPTMLERGAGAIVNMSSTAARFPTPGLSVYSASKAGIEAFTRAIAAEGAPTVRVNAVSAGPTLTETVSTLMNSDTTGAVAAVTKALPLQRLGRPEEIAEAVLFLASTRASFVTGQILHVNGGGFMA